MPFKQNYVVKVFLLDSTNWRRVSLGSAANVATLTSDPSQRRHNEAMYFTDLRLSKLYICHVKASAVLVFGLIIAKISKMFKR
jgi:hypothetical protein